MRHSTSAHLLGIPDLPEDAFKHIGDRKIRPQGLGKFVKWISGGAVDVTGIDLSKPLKDIGIDLGKAKDWINSKVENLVPGGWTTLGEVALSFTPLGVAGAAGLGALSGGTGGFRKKGFDLTGAIMGGLQGYGVGSLTQGLMNAGAPTPTQPQASMTYNTEPTILPDGSATFEVATNQLPNPNPNLAGTSGLGTENLSTITPGDAGGNLGGQASQLPSAPSGLEKLGNTMSSNASQAGQGIQNLVGAGPQGLGGIMPAAEAVHASMGYTAYAGLASLGLEELEKRRMKNEDDHNKGLITDSEYAKNQAMIDQAVASAKENVSKYPYQPEEENYTQQETYYPRQGTTLYENKPVRYASSGGGLGSLYAQGGPVSDETPDTMMAGGITNGFRFASGGTLYAEAQGNPGDYPDSPNILGSTALFDFLREKIGEAKSAEDAKAAAKKQMSDFRYEEETAGNYSPYSLGSTLYKQKKDKSNEYASGGFLSKMAEEGVSTGKELEGVIRRIEAEKSIQEAAAQKAAAKAAEEKQAELVKPMSQFTYPSDSSGSSSPTDYSNLGELLYRQKKLERGGYAQGGEARFLSGGGDGMSDSIKARIDGHQEARLADGEFVIPADVVSHLGNGSSKAGAKQLHAMMDRVRKARTGNPKQGKQINPMKFMPA